MRSIPVADNDGFPEHASEWMLSDVSPVVVPVVNPDIENPNFVGRGHWAVSTVPLNGKSGLRSSANGDVRYNFESIDFSGLIPSFVLRVNAALDADFTLNGVEGVLEVIRGRVVIGNSGNLIPLEEGESLDVQDGSLKVVCLTPDLELKVPARVK